MNRRSSLVTWGLPLLALAAGGAAVLSIARKQPVNVAVAPTVAPPTQPGTVTGAAPKATAAAPPTAPGNTASTTPAASGSAISAASGSTVPAASGSTVPAASGSTVPAASGSTRGFVGAAGIVEPSSQEIALGAHVSGIVSEVLATPGASIAAGAPLFRLDARALDAQLTIRKAELAAAERRLAQLQARIPSLTATRDAARAAVSAVQAELEDWQDQKRTADALKARGDSAISEREVTKRRNSERAASGRLAEAQARAAQADAELDLVAKPGGGASLEVERANVEQARAALKRAEIDLDLLTVRAPMDAAVLQVNVRPGEFAQAGSLATPLMVLGNLAPMHVRVDIDEMDVPLFSPEARGYASLRGQAARRVPLSFVRVDPIVVPKKSLTGASFERVDTRVLRVVYALPRQGFPAYSGQLVDVFIEAAASPEAAAPTSPAVAADAPAPRR